ncbi:ArsR/SmtB family transcription factor [Nostoc sp.]|uniref:ArsR/SmtB family transcription factor n=1 Tax=Nostoc sp. TaxID=1180 RepID=UPI002FF5B720
MKTLYHPPLESVQVESILHALADRVRVAIFMDISASECPLTCSTFLKIHEKPIPKSTLSLHFRILREAGLIRSVRQGVEMHNTSRCKEIDSLFPGLLQSIVNAHKIQLEGQQRGVSTY